MRRFFDTVFLCRWGITKLSDYVQINSLLYWEDGEKLLEKLKNSHILYNLLSVLSFQKF